MLVVNAGSSSLDLHDQLARFAEARTFVNQRFVSFSSTVFCRSRARR